MDIQMYAYDIPVKLMEIFCKDTQDQSMIKEAAMIGASIATICPDHSTIIHFYGTVGEQSYDEQDPLAVSAMMAVEEDQAARIRDWSMDVAEMTFLQFHEYRIMGRRWISVSICEKSSAPTSPEDWFRIE